MNEIPANIKERIESLLLKTVRNGATASEEQSAKEMAVRLKARYREIEPPVKSTDNRQKISYKIDWGKIATEYLSPLNYKMYKLLGYFSNDLVLKISWDLVASSVLHYQDYYDFIDNTESEWKARNSAASRYLGEQKYRLECYKELMKIVS